MEIGYTGGKIRLEKKLNALDRLAIDFTSALDSCGIRYVLVSGYISILFGRSRASEDIDIIMEKIDFEQFQKLWVQAYKDFECITTEEVQEAYTDYLTTNHAIRFSRKNTFIPNMEVKFPKVDLDAWALRERKEVAINNALLFISPIELQIAFKLYLGSEKDIEDAKHLYEVLKENLDMQLLREFNRKLEIEKTFDRYLK